MEQNLTQQETIRSSQNEAGSKQESWMKVRKFFAKKTCLVCGAEFRPSKWCKELDFKKQRFCSVSCSKKMCNPMFVEQTKEKMRQSLLRIKHRPIKRGGNGHYTAPQLHMKEMLGQEWELEYAISLGGRLHGYPTCYKVDLGNTSTKTAIEIDGKSHYGKRKILDKKKDNMLATLGWKVFRFSNVDAEKMYTTWKSTGILPTSLMGF